MVSNTVDLRDSGVERVDSLSLGMIIGAFVKTIQLFGIMAQIAVTTLAMETNDYVI